MGMPSADKPRSCHHFISIHTTIAPGRGNANQEERVVADDATVGDVAPRTLHFRARSVGQQVHEADLSAQHERVRGGDAHRVLPTPQFEMLSDSFALNDCFRIHA
jgi:hypothetical protein